jgi:hypothetical protein
VDAPGVHRRERERENPVPDQQFVDADEHETADADRRAEGTVHVRTARADRTKITGTPTTASDRGVCWTLFSATLGVQFLSMHTASDE